MKQKILGLRTAIYPVADINAARQWYENAFETAPYFNEPFYVGFDIGGYELGLLPDENPVINKTENVVAYWGVDDINAEFERMKSLGAEEVETPHDVGGDIKVAKLKDPWGNYIGLIFNPHFKLP